MPDTKISGLTELTELQPDTDMVEVLDKSDTTMDAAGTNKKMNPDNFVGEAFQDFILHNLIRNNPGQIVTDGSEPQWWDESGANATLTDEDAAGEACSDKFERVFKCVTTADDEYGLQTLTFSDEELLDAGVTEVSLGVWVWCSAASTASVGLYGTNAGLTESDQHTGGSGWELLTVEGFTLDAADTDLEVRLICDTGTAFFGKMSLIVGPKAVMLKPRGLLPVPTDNTVTADYNTTGDVADSDLDFTATTDNLAVLIEVRVFITESDGTAGSSAELAHDDAFGTADWPYLREACNVLGETFVGHCTFMCNDNQVLRHAIDEEDADADVRAVYTPVMYWMWE